MEETNLLHFTTQAMMLVLYMSMPAILAATIVGLVIGLIQALTSIQEQTLPHGFKMVAVAAVLAMTVSWMGPELYKYAITLFDQIAVTRAK